MTTRPMGRSEEAWPENPSDLKTLSHQDLATHDGRCAPAFGRGPRFVALAALALALLPAWARAQEPEQADAPEATQTESLGANDDMGSLQGAAAPLAGDPDRLFGDITLTPEEAFLDLRLYLLLA